MPHSAGQTIKPLIRLGRDPGDCYGWDGAVHPVTGQASKTVDGKSMPARRWFWQTMFGPIPEGFVVTTSCGNKTCLNPHHLRATTQAENCRAGVTATLTAEDVREIRAARKNKTLNTRAVLAERYGVSPSTISDVWGRKSWRKPKPFHGPRKNAPQENAA